MGNSLYIDELRSLQNRHPGFNNIKTFVETGTQYGNTIFSMSRYFDKLTTIELSKEHWENAKNKAKENGIFNINFVNGDSAVELSRVLKEINEPAIFFLDGHHCGFNTDKLAAKGDIEVPLYQELRAIKESHNFKSLILIDDSRLFNKKLVAEDLDWSNITVDGLIDCLGSDRILEHFEANDRYVIYLK
jgi:hypothetical protein